jgi:hypothetical protein
MQQTTINLKSARDAIHDGISRDIRRVAQGSQEITLPVALSNWEHYFSLCQFTEARRWWAMVHERMQEGN